MTHLYPSFLRRIKAALFLALLFLPFHLGIVAATTVNDVTQLNPIEVDTVIEPTTIEEIVRAVRSHKSPISIGGGRFSMGGQTATEGALQIDMRKFDKVINFSKEKKQITVQTGITWRKIQEFIDPHDLSLQIMQTYANFTVGGSLSVNVHGRYIGQGPLVYSVKSIRMVLPNGSVVEASPTTNRDIFYGAIGGYGALGVIAEATLSLADNVRVERLSKPMPIGDYKNFFINHIRDNSNVVFHNADIYPNAYDTIRAVSYVKTEKPVTVEHRLMPADRSYWLDRFVYWVISERPFGKSIRQHVIDPLVYWSDRVEWRNYEASYDVRELEPRSRATSTYVLQEYFVPVEKLERFVSLMGQTLNRHKVNVVNVSIRYAKKDPGTLLAWAKTEVFAFVLYYKQGTSPAERQAVAIWTRELIDAATSLNGAYYLPYQIHATNKQLRAAYPNIDSFFSLKRRLDPENRFRNKLLDAYYKPTAEKMVASTAKNVDFEVLQQFLSDLKQYPGYQRDESQTYLTLPEWFLVYNPSEYARFIYAKPPSDFPYFGSIGQFWGYYRDAYSVTKEKYGFNWGYHVMVFVIGSSFTVENAIKGIYENTVGRLSEWISSDAPTEEDRFAAKVAQDYVDFIRVDPWYEFPFATKLKKLWAETGLFGPNMLRKWERKIYLSAEYVAKAQYALIIKLGTKVAYGDADSEILMLVSNIKPGVVDTDSSIRILRQAGQGRALLALPRYEEFRKKLMHLTTNGIRFQEIAGNDEILITTIVPSAWKYDLLVGKSLFERPIISNPDMKRIAIEAPVTSLHEILLSLSKKGFEIEHVYDY